MHTIILAGGNGRRLWPFQSVRNKAMLPVGNAPLIRHMAERVLEATGGDLTVAVGPFEAQLGGEFLGNPRVRVLPVGATAGSADTLHKAGEALGRPDCLVLPCDVLIEASDLRALVERFSRTRNACCLLAPVEEGQQAGEICARVEDGKLVDFVGHPFENTGFKPVGYALNEAAWRFVLGGRDVFTNVDVGMMPPDENQLELALKRLIDAGGCIEAVMCDGPAFDIDKPWHIMEANLHMAHAIAGGLAETSLDEGASIDPTAQIEGRVKLGTRAQIGRNAVIRGNVVVGEGSRILDGAILEGDILIGRGCAIGPYCQIASASVIGDNCVVGHCAEFQGVLFDNVALGHFMEIWGVIGQSVDFGAGTLCGTLRFDNAQVSQSVMGRREQAGRYANALYMGDFSRTGVGAKLMPGLKIGCRSIVGAGVLASEDVPDNTALLLKQEHVVKKWGSERYGW